MAKVPDKNFFISR